MSQNPLPIVLYPDPILRRSAEEIVEIDADVTDLAEAMIAKMVECEGIGLAGPQVGRLDRIFTLKIGDHDPMVFINPEITATSAELSSYEEGCLSIPSQYADVQRPAELQIQAWNTRGRPFTIEVNDILATVIQHELDHLNGILFIDHLSERKRNKILGRFDVEADQYPEVE